MAGRAAPGPASLHRWTRHAGGRIPRVASTSTSVQSCAAPSPPSGGWSVTPRPRFTDPTSTVSPVTPSTHQPRTFGPVSAVVSTVTDAVPACRTTRSSPDAVALPTTASTAGRAGCPAVSPGGISEGSTARPSTAAMTAPLTDGHGGRTCNVILLPAQQPRSDGPVRGLPAAGGRAVGHSAPDPVVRRRHGIEGG